MKESLCTQCGKLCRPSLPGQRVQTDLHGGIPKILSGEIEDCSQRVDTFSNGLSGNQNQAPGQSK